MFFDLTEEQQMLQATVADYFTSEFPLATVRQAADGQLAERQRLWRDLAKLGAPGITLADEYGGSGLGVLDAAVLLEECGAAAAPAALLEHLVAGLAVAASGDPEQRGRLLPGLASGEKRATVAISEGRGKWRPDRWSVGAGGGLDGVKRFVVGAVTADVIVVGTSRGFSVVEPGAPGVELEEVGSIDPTRPLHTLRLSGAAGEALDVTPETVGTVYDTALVLAAAQSFGGARRCVDMSAQYAKTREQFGTTIAHFQGVKHQFANLAVDVVPARTMYWYAAHLIVTGDADAARFAALTKAHICERYQRASRDMIELHGGIGYTWESDTNLLAKRALFDLGYLGTPASLREYVAQANGWLPVS